MKRYIRQQALVSQEKLHEATVLIAGVGGLGGFSALYLAQAGVGKLIIVDMDTVEESNLNRQVLYRFEDIGNKKVDVAARRLKEINPDTEIVPIFQKIDSSFTIPADTQLIIDGLDNPESRLILLNLSEQRKIPYIFGAVEGYMGMVSFVSGHSAKIANIIKKSTPQNPSTLGTVAGMTAAIQATEAIKYLSGTGDLLTDRLIIYDSLSTNYTEVKL